MRGGSSLDLSDPVRARLPSNVDTSFHISYILGPLQVFHGKTITLAHPDEPYKQKSGSLGKTPAPRTRT